MFTGLVQAVGRVLSLEGGVLRLETWEGADLEVGESVAVNGVCLTVVENLRFDLSEETLRRSSLGAVEAGSRVNLERAMALGDRLGGHIVQGHVDATATVAAIRPSGNSVVFTFEVEPGDERYLIDKGSVALDGISLTVVEPVGSRFDVWVIPHTLEMTNLGDRQVGDRVNVEYDVIAKHVERLLAFRGSAPQQ